MTSITTLPVVTPQVVLTKGATKAHLEMLEKNVATYKNSKIGTEGEQHVIGGYVMDDDGQWKLLMPTGTPKDYIGRATHEMNLTKKKTDTIARLRLKLEKKKQGK